MKVLFYHGGPGLNSNPEKEILTGEFKAKGYQLICWNEPSSLRSTGLDIQYSFQHYLLNAEEFLISNYNGTPLIIIGHSFGAQICVYLSQKHPSKIKQIILVSSNLAVKNTDLNTFSFIAADLVEHDDENAKIMDDVIQKYTGTFDENTQLGFSIAGQNPRLFDYYWHNKPLMHQFLAHYTSPNYVLDVNAYFQIRKTWFELKAQKSAILVTAVYGKHEQVVSNLVEQKKAREYFNRIEFHDFHHSAHYPHVEEADLFLQLLSPL
ncbi:MAG TPA: alpha/beta hydrolase [Pedobacter sp.]|nr:alpha/beta hydrolase [Pedobacter sp.]